MISLRNVSKTYQAGARSTPALRGVDLEVRRGEIFGIIGASGAGKSTLVRLVNSLDRPDTGSVEVNGRSTNNVRGRELLELRRQIGMVFQHFNLLSAKTVAENVAFPLRLAGGQGGAAIRERVAELLDRVGLSEHASSYPRQLSGGQKQRVGIARALACRPAILLCDEATSALDPETTRSVLRLLAEINRELGLTIVLITHEMDVVRQICHRVAVLDAGRVVETGPVEEVFLHPRHPATVALVREAVGEDAALPVGEVATGATYRLTLIGTGARSPILGEIARAHGVDFAILGGQIGRIRDKPYAQLTVALSGGDIDRALALLDAEGIDVEELVPAPPRAEAPLRELADVV